MAYAREATCHGQDRIVAHYLLKEALWVDRLSEWIQYDTRFRENMQSVAWGMM